MSAASSPEAPKVQEGPNRRLFLARGAAVAAVPAVAALAGGAFAERASAGSGRFRRILGVGPRLVLRSVIPCVLPVAMR
jgi:hypothetical protein